MAPAADAVRLVDGQHADARCLRHVLEQRTTCVAVQELWRHIEKLQVGLWVACLLEDV